MEHEIINGVEILIERAENYLQINDASEEELRSVWAHITTNYPSHELVFCYHNTAAPLTFLQEIDAALLEDCTELRLSVEDFEKLHMQDKPISELNMDDSTTATMITPINAVNFGSFAKLHDNANPDMSWTSRRILERPDLWSIFACFDNDSITDYIMIMQPAAEIFCVHTENLARAKALLTAAALHSFNTGAKELLYMIDKDEEICKNASVTLGFKACGYYHGYKVNVPSKKG